MGRQCLRLDYVDDFGNAPAAPVRDVRRRRFPAFVDNRRRSGRKTRARHHGDGGLLVLDCRHLGFSLRAGLPGAAIFVNRKFAMKRKVNKKKLWIQAAVVLLLLAGAVAAFIRSENKPMSKDEIKIAAADLRSFSAAGAQLCAQFLDGQTTETFLKTQSSLLEDKVADLKKQLDS